MKNILNYLFEHKILSYDKAKEILIKIAQGEYSEAEIAAFLSVYIMRSVKVDELKGFRDALLELCLRIDLSEFETIDLCGTGGDGKNTFNISTCTSFVVAGTGFKVAKHGNYGVSSSCGSSNLLEHLGYKFSSDVSKLKTELDKSGICFLHAPLFHPAMKNVAPIRRSLGIKTFFNMLGPMVNPSFPANQLVGVFSLELSRLYNYLYQQSDKNYMIIHNLDGYDEVSLTDDVKITSNSLDQILKPEDFGLKTLDPATLHGGDSVKEAADIFISVLEGASTEAQKNVVLANSALALKTIDNNKSFSDCIEEARESIDSKKALQVLKTLIDMQP